MAVQNQEEKKNHASKHDHFLSTVGPVLLCWRALPPLDSNTTNNKKEPSQEKNKTQKMSQN